MKYFLHYRPADGEIIGWGNGFDPILPIGDNAVAFMDEPVSPNPLTQKYDEASNSIVDKTPEQVRQAQLPGLIEVQRAIWMELARTDQFMLADRDVAGDDWAGYRQMLRDLSKRFEQPADMINAWELPPDGSDPISELRERL